MTLPPHLSPSDFHRSRHLGAGEGDVSAMLRSIGCDSLDALMDETVPASIRASGSLVLPAALSENQALTKLTDFAEKNQVMRSFIGMGYYPCNTPPVVQRNILEGPGWYTQYTPYQPEISQGRLEALLNFQTMVSDLTGLPLSNGSLLDEATAAAEAMTMCRRIAKVGGDRFWVGEECHPQTIAVVKTRAEALGIELIVDRFERLDVETVKPFGVLLSYPTTDGRIEDYRSSIQRGHDAGAVVVLATDLLALTLLTSPGEMGADIAIGSSQRFGVPLGFGGPHAAFLAARDSYKRHIPGRIVGVTRDASGQTAYRLALQTREQHIRRDRATSNICTAQVLLAIMASMYAVYHGPQGLRQIAKRVRGWTRLLAAGLRQLGYSMTEGPVFDTLRIPCDARQADEIFSRAKQARVNLRRYPDHAVGVSLDERVDRADIERLLTILTPSGAATPALTALIDQSDSAADYPVPVQRTSDFMSHPVFHQYHTEHELLRYIYRLQSKDLSLTTSMIPLGSCTMKLNATVEMIPISWSKFADIHPYAPEEQTQGYAKLIESLEHWLAEITGFAATSLQPNSGAQGEYAGLLAIRGFHLANGHTDRTVCLIPASAHGTNPASAVLAGFQVVPVLCDDQGNVDMADLAAKAASYSERLGAIMITYPSTHGVFEPTIREVCRIVHEHGGQVYLDGANMNAQVGLCRPGDYGADVCHLNLHKTFCIPHGGGGPGIGPIVVAAHLAKFLPSHPLQADAASEAVGPVSAAPYGSPGILAIPWMYIALMGPDGLRQASELAILNANYMATRLTQDYDIVFRGENGRVAHEFVLDCRPFKKSCGVTVEDIAKRLMDFGFHAPTMSWPVAGTLMIEPTESESKQELDRFCDAMIAIRREIGDIEQGRVKLEQSPLRLAPHTSRDLAAADWDRPYPREQAIFPAPWSKLHKYWPPVSRVDNTYGDRNLVCSCPPLESYL